MILCNAPALSLPCLQRAGFRRHPGTDLSARHATMDAGAISALRQQWPRTLSAFGAERRPSRQVTMCNLYSITKSQEAVRQYTHAMNDRAGNMPPLPGILPITASRSAIHVI